MEVDDQIQAAASLPTEKETPVPIGWEAGWASESVWSRYFSGRTEENLEKHNLDIRDLPPKILIQHLIPRKIQYFFSHL
jgi:hypothetical protein